MINGNVPKVHLIYLRPELAMPTDRNFDFQPAYKGESLIQGERVCKGGRGRLCTHARRAFFCDGERNWGLPDHKMHVDEGKIRGIPQLVRIFPMPMCVGDD